jgi:hypothetical protein
MLKVFWIPPCMGIDVLYIFIVLFIVFSLLINFNRRRSVGHSSDAFPCFIALDQRPTSAALRG